MKTWDKVNAKRKEKRVKIKEIAKELGITKQTLYYHIRNIKEKEKNTFSVEQMQKISDILKEDISIFFD